jgi:hypothetical protein
MFSSYRSIQIPHLVLSIIVIGGFILIMVDISRLIVVRTIVAMNTSGVLVIVLLIIFVIVNRM